MTLLRICWLVNVVTFGLILLSLYNSYRTLPADASIEPDVRAYYGMWIMWLTFFGTGWLVSYLLHRSGWATTAKILAFIPAGFATAIVAIGLVYVLIFIFGTPSR